MEFYPFLCLDGTELAFGDRTLAYLRNGLLDFPGTIGDVYNCDVLRDGETFSDPMSDEAPWYNPMVPASAEFLGINPISIDVLTVLQRKVVTRARGGGVVGPLTPQPRVLQFQGHMFASTERGMAYGDRWVNEVLANENCNYTPFNEVLLAPACPETEDDLRRIFDAGVTDGPIMTPSDLPHCKMSVLNFQLTAGVPHLFSPDISITEESASSYFAEELCYYITTIDSPGDAVVNITLTATTDLGYIHMWGKPTFDMDCPHPDGMPSWEITLDSLEKNAVLTIDSARQQIRFRDPSLKQDRSGVGMVNFKGPLNFPEIYPCSEYCLCIGVLSGEFDLKVDKIIREW